MGLNGARLGATRIRRSTRSNCPTKLKDFAREMAGESAVSLTDDRERILAHGGA